MVAILLLACDWIMPSSATSDKVMDAIDASSARDDF